MPPGGSVTSVETHKGVYGWLHPFAGGRDVLLKLTLSCVSLLVAPRLKWFNTRGAVHFHAGSFHDLSKNAGAPPCAAPARHWHPADLIPYHSWFKSSREEAPVYRAFVLCPVCSLSLSGLSGLHWRLGSNLPARGCVSCVGAVAQSICLHHWAGAAVGLGQQDPAKHQLLAAFYTDSHQEGHIYSTASSPVRLEDLSALSAWIFLPSLLCSAC